MNIDLIPFAYEGTSVRLVTDDNGEPWFVAKDVCNVLEITNHRSSLDGSSVHGVQADDDPLPHGCGFAPHKGVDVRLPYLPERESSEGWEQVDAEDGPV